MTRSTWGPLMSSCSPPTQRSRRLYSTDGISSSSTLRKCAFLILQLLAGNAGQLMKSAAKTTDHLYSFIFLPTRKVLYYRATKIGRYSLLYQCRGKAPANENFTVYM